MIDKETIKKNFSKYARYYDRYATVQALSALELIAKIDAGGFESILDLGCGTGNYTKLLKEKFPCARIKAVDISPEMIAVAKEKLRGGSIEFIVADGETLRMKEKFDLISSNASFQWFEDPENALLGYRGLLNEGGIILFSAFGPRTFCELEEALGKLWGKDAKTSSSDFFGKEKLKSTLKRIFNDGGIEEKVYREKFGSLAELLTKIRYSGIRGNGGGNRNFWTAGTIRELEKIYKGKDKDITATYQVFFCRGAK